nr:diaminobutyrate acetyltransferase [Brevibacillus humidisoli]
MRKPSEEDGAAMWKLVRDSGVLDQNSAYAYLMYCKFFADTCVIAEWEDEVVGFVTAFCPPTAPDTVFVWQIGVNKQQRGMGVGSKMLRELLQRESCKQVRYLEATVSPSNLPSASLFRKAARELGAPCEVTECFPADLFPGETHETELTFRIGPFKGKQ